MNDVAHATVNQRAWYEQNDERARTDRDGLRNGTAADAECCCAADRPPAVLSVRARVSLAYTYAVRGDICAHPMAVRWGSGARHGRAGGGTSGQNFPYFTSIAIFTIATRIFHLVRE